MIERFVKDRLIEQSVFDHRKLVSRGWTSCTLQSDSEVTLREHLQTFATQLGEPMPTRGGRNVTETLRPTIAEAARRHSLSRAYGLGEFPLHSDTAQWLLPCRYIVLACLATGRGNRATFLLDTWQLPITDRQRALLRTAPIRITNGRKSFFSTILSSQRSFIRYDPGCMTPVMDDGVLAMEVLAKTNWPEFVEEVQWHPGKVVIIDNWRVLHGRGPTTCRDSERTLIRIYIR